MKNYGVGFSQARLIECETCGQLMVFVKKGYAFRIARPE